MERFFNKAIFYEQWSRLWAFIIVIVFIIGIKPITFLKNVETIECIKSFDEIPDMMNIGINLEFGDYFLLIAMLMTLVALSIGTNKQKNLSFLNSKNVTRKQILGTQFISTITISMIAVVISTIIRVIVYFSVKEVYNQYLNIYMSDIVIYFFTVSVVIMNVLSVTFLYQLLIGHTIVSILAVPATFICMIIGPMILWRVVYHIRFINELGKAIEKMLFKLHDTVIQEYLRGETFSRKEAVTWILIVLIVTVVLIFIIFLLNQYYEVQNLSNLFIFNKAKKGIILLITIISTSFISLILYLIYASFYEKSTGVMLSLQMEHGEYLHTGMSDYENMVRYICNAISFMVAPFIYMLLNKIVNVIDGVEGKKIRKIKI